MIRGYAIELMDGDNSFIWTKWVKRVLLQLSQSIKSLLDL